MFEFEKKILLTKTEYDYLRSDERFSKRLSLQKNYYYDTEKHELNELGITCRIRERNGKYKATLKAHQPDIENFSIETSGEAENERDLSFFKNMALLFQGELDTYRINYIPQKNIRISLDENIYLSTIDYELEIEYNPKEEKTAARILNDIANDLLTAGIIKNKEEFIKRAENAKSKSERFFEKKYYKKY